MVVSLPSIYKNISAPAGTNPADAQSAKDQLALEFAPKESSITNTINQLQGFLQSDTAAQQQFGQVADQKISDIGSTLAQQLQGNVGAIGDIYKQGQQQVGSAYDEAGATLGAVGSSVQKRLTDSATQLGQTQALQADRFGNDPLSRLQGNLAILQGRNATGKAGSVSNLTSLGTQLQGIAQKAVGDSERNYAQKRTDIATQVLKTVGQLQVQTNQKTGDLLQQFSDLAAQEGPAFRQILNQLTAARTAADRQSTLDSIDALLKQSQIDKNTAGSDPNSLDNIIKGQTIQKNEQALNPALTYKSDPQGNADMMDVLNQLRQSGTITGYQWAGVQRFIDQNLPNTQLQGIYNTNDPAAILRSIAQQNLDPKTGKVKLPSVKGTKGKPEEYEISMQDLLEILNTRFSNVGTSKQVGAKVK